jgi:hypothetical protein
MTSWERILNLYLILGELCCGAVIIALIIEFIMKISWKKKYDLNKRSKPDICNYKLIEGQLYYDCINKVWYMYKNGKWVKE